MPVFVKRGTKLIDIFSQMGRGTVLDIPGGRGKESLHLRGLGYRVFLVDLSSDGKGTLSVPSVQADCNDPLPFSRGVFDYVLSREGIEHLENQAGFLRECARVLRPRGTIVLTTPNIMHLASRLSHFFTGQRTFRRGLTNEVQTLRGAKGARFYHGHIFLTDYFRLRYLLRLAGFDDIEVFTDRYSPTSIAMAWIVPVLFAASKLSIKFSSHNASRKKVRSAPPSLLKEILRHVFSPALLFGKRMIVVAQRIPS